jgi:hypothetical protein
MKRLLVVLLLFAGSALAQAHTASLAWTQSTTPGVTGNNVCRATVSGGPYTLVSPSAFGPATTFVDSTVAGGTTYFYVVTAYITASSTPCTGVAPESVFSTQATAAIPVTPNAPTGLTITVK